LLLVAAAIFISPASAGGCAEEMIRSVVCAGSIVFLDSGGVYEVQPDDISATGFGAPETTSWCAATRE
ncbi:MAG: hypothetical protein ACRED2_05045, partial [Methylocella sp.]